MANTVQFKCKGSLQSGSHECFQSTVSTHHRSKQNRPQKPVSIGVQFCYSELCKWKRKLHVDCNSVGMARWHGGAAGSIAASHLQGIGFDPPELRLLFVQSSCMRDFPPPLTRWTDYSKGLLGVNECVNVRACCFVFHPGCIPGIGSGSSTNPDQQ